MVMYNPDQLLLIDSYHSHILNNLYKFLPELHSR